jgi:hypothetical protein
MNVANGYINLPFTADRDTMIQTALGNIATAMPGWKPREGNLEVLLLEQFADMAAEAAQVASQVPVAVFEYFGGLLGLSQNTGTQAVISTTWSVSSAAPSRCTFPAGTAANAVINGVFYQFTTVQDVPVSPGGTGTVNMIAASAGSSYNNVKPPTFLQPLYYNSYLSSIQVTSSVTAGVDAESTSTYLDRLSNTLATYTQRPIVSNDFASLAANVLGVGRATAIDNSNPFVNILPVNVAQPASMATTGWTALNGSTVTVSSTGASVATPAATSSSFAGASSPAISAGGTFLPFTTTTTSSSGSYTAGSSTTLPVTDNSAFATAGAGYIVVGGIPVYFTYR